MARLKLRILVVIVVVILIMAGGTVYYFSLQKQKSTAPAEQGGKEETLAEKQIKELGELRQKSGDQPLSQEQIQKQLEELEKLRLAQ